MATNHKRRRRLRFTEDRERPGYYTLSDMGGLFSRVGICLSGLQRVFHVPPTVTAIEFEYGPSYGLFNNDTDRTLHDLSVLNDANWMRFDFVVNPGQESSLVDLNQTHIILRSLTHPCDATFVDGNDMRHLGKLYRFIGYPTGICRCHVEYEE